MFILTFGANDFDAVARIEANEAFRDRTLVSLSYPLQSLAFLIRSNTVQEDTKPSTVPGMFQLSGVAEVTYLFGTDGKQFSDVFHTCLGAR
jgi:hypothetical protein